MTVTRSSTTGSSLWRMAPTALPRLYVFRHTHRRRARQVFIDPFYRGEDRDPSIMAGKRMAYPEILDITLYPLGI